MGRRRKKGGGPKGGGGKSSDAIPANANGQRSQASGGPPGPAYDRQGNNTNRTRKVSPQSRRNVDVTVNSSPGGSSLGGLARSSGGRRKSSARSRDVSPASSQGGQEDELLGELPSGTLDNFGQALSQSLAAVSGQEPSLQGPTNTSSKYRTEVLAMQERLSQLPHASTDDAKLSILGWLSGTLIKTPHREMLHNNRELLAGLVPPLYCANVSVQWHAARVISTLCFNDSSTALVIGDAGGVDALVSILQRDTALEVRQESLWALLYLTSHQNFLNMDAFAEACDGEAFSLLVGVLSSPDDLSVQLSARIVANLAAVPEHRLSLCRLGITRSLLSLLAAVDEGVSKYATVALGALSYDETCRFDICDLGGVAVMLHTGRGDLHLQQLSCLILSNISFTADLRNHLIQEREVLEHCVTLAEGGDLLIQREVAKLFVNLTATRELLSNMEDFALLDVFCSMLTSPNNNIKILALGGLANLCSDPMQCDEIVSSGGRGPLRRVLDLAMSPEASVQELAVQLIGDLVAVDDTRQHTVCEAGGAALLIYLLSAPSMNIRLRATKALANLAEGTHLVKNRLVDGGVLAPLISQLYVESVDLWQLTAYTIGALVATKPLGRAYRHADGLKPLVGLLNAANSNTHPTALEYVLKAVHSVLTADSNNMREMYNIAGWKPFANCLSVMNDRVQVRTLAVLLEMSKFRDIRGVMCVPELYNALIPLNRSQYDVVRALAQKLLIGFGTDLPPDIREYLGIPDPDDPLSPGTNSMTELDVGATMRQSRAAQQGELLQSGQEKGGVSTTTESNDEFYRDNTHFKRRPRPRSHFQRIHKLSSAGFFARGVLSDSSDAPSIPRSANIAFPGADDSEARSGQSAAETSNAEGLSATERVQASVRAVAKPVGRAVGNVIRKVRVAASYVHALPPASDWVSDDDNDADRSEYVKSDSGAESPWST